MAGNERETVENRLLEVEFQKEAYSQRLKDIQGEIDARANAKEYPGPPPWTADGQRYDRALGKEHQRIDSDLAKVEVAIMECRSKLNRINVREAQALEKAAELEKSKGFPMPSLSPSPGNSPSLPQTSGQAPGTSSPGIGGSMSYEPEIDDI